MLNRTSRIYLVISISCARAVLALLFAATAFQLGKLGASAIYGAAMASDFLDGFLARRLNVATASGRLIDMICDKCLTVVSLIYAHSRGILLFPLALLATREILALGLRLIAFGEKAVLPKNRPLTRLMVLVMWSDTLFLTLCGEIDGAKRIASLIYWGCAILFTSMFLKRVWDTRTHIKPFLMRSYPS